MRRCPKCNSVYSDDTLNYCLLDGSVLVFNERSSAESEKPTVDFGSLETVIANRYANEVLQFRENRRKEEKGHRIEIFESELDLTKVKFGGPETVFSCAYPRRFEAKPALKISAFREDGEKESLDWIKIVEETRGVSPFQGSSAEGSNYERGSAMRGESLRGLGSSQLDGVLHESELLRVVNVSRTEILI
jgi:hypothetical protein